jgi:F-type H+-transporting ATPase subunit c
MFHFMGVALVFHHLIAATTQSYSLVGEKAGKAIALGVGAGGGAAGAGAGIGMLFGKVIESVTRQPEMKGEISSIQWLGFALTEACFFYGLVGGFIAFFL